MTARARRARRGRRVATHDVEFAAAFADRVVLLGPRRGGRRRQRGEILSGGWYFSTEVARILDGAAVRVEGVAVLQRVRAGRTDPVEGRPVSWQLAELRPARLTLAAGAAWYERCRPPSRLLAPRGARRPCPRRPGRVLTDPQRRSRRPTSRSFRATRSAPLPGFGLGRSRPRLELLPRQGPWTPWQMAGWGPVRRGGAALAALTRRRPGRFGLAAFCGFAGFAFGALMDLSLMVTYGGEQSLDRFLALSARGLPFNIAHAAGNVALALAAGPAIARMLSRYPRALRVRVAEAPPSRPVAPRGWSRASAACSRSRSVLASSPPANRRAAPRAVHRRRSPGCAASRTPTAASAPAPATTPIRR